MISDQKDRMIKSMKELKEHCIKGCNDFYVLSGGIIRGSRDIYYNEENKSWYVWYAVCDVETEYKNDEEFIEEEFIIMEAMKNNCFFRHEQ